MFILDWLPTILFQILLVVGIGGSFVMLFFDHIIPLAYDVLIKVAILIALVLGVAGVVHDADAKAHKSEMDEAKAQISQLETASAQITTKTVIQYVDRIKVVKEKGDVIEKQIPIYVPVESDAKCVIDSGFVRGYNSAASEIPGTAVKPDGASSAAK